MIHMNIAEQVVALTKKVQAIEASSTSSLT